MSRTALTVQTLANINAITAGAAALTLTAADIVNFNSFVHTGREMLLVQNSGASAYTVTINSTADVLGRTGDITAYSIPAGGFAIFGPFPLNGWHQNTTPYTVNLQASNASVLFAVIQLPSSY